MRGNFQLSLAVVILVLAKCASERQEPTPLGYRSAVARPDPVSRSLKGNADSIKEPGGSDGSSRPVRRRALETHSVVYERSVDAEGDRLPPPQTVPNRESPSVPRDSEDPSSASGSSTDLARKKIAARYSQLLKLGFITKEQYETAMKGEKK